jgi:hypothetical protein
MYGAEGGKLELLGYSQVDPEAVAAGKRKYHQ